MERFVRLVVGGGVVLLAGLWTRALTGPGSTAWLVGTALALLGAVGTLAGVAVAVDVRG